MTETMNRLSDYILQLESALVPVSRTLVEMQNVQAQNIIGTEEAAHYLRCTEGTLRVWVSKRKVPHLKVGRLVRFRRKDLDKWLDDHLVS